MTGERQQDVFLIALIASVAVHVALMFLIKPQVMTAVSLGAVKTHDRGPMTVRADVTIPEPIRIESVTDVEAVRGSPEAETTEVPPVTVAYELAETEISAARPEIAEAPVAELPLPEIALAPHLAEKIHVDADIQSLQTPIAAETVPIAAPMAAAPSIDSSGPITPDVALPLFTSPMVMPQADATLALSVPDRNAPIEYTPPKSVYATVDEKTVEAEKAAVRRLLDGADALELASKIRIASDSATDGDWTYFRLKIDPTAELPVVPKDIVILLDASGSIGKDRFESCRKAARSLLRSVTNTGDRFNLVAFRDQFSYASKNWCDCTQGNFDAADKWLNRLAAHGRTDVFATIRSVLTLPRDPKRPLIALVVTDGDANTGVSETAAILAKFTALNDGLISVYMYGVKAEANRELIDCLTHGNRGESFIYGGARWNAGKGIETLSERFRDPVLSDLRLVFSSGTPAEAYPCLLRNLYRGETVDIVGRVPHGTTEIGFSLKGLNGSTAYESFFRIDLSKSAFDKNLPDAWLTEKALDRKLR